MTVVTTAVLDPACDGDVPGEPGEGIGDGAARGVRAERELVGLAHVGDRKCVADRDQLGRGGGFGDPLARPLAQLVPGRRGAGYEGDVRDGHLTGVDVRPADGAGRGDLRMGQQGVLDDRGVDVVARHG